MADREGRTHAVEVGAPDARPAEDAPHVLLERVRRDAEDAADRQRRGIHAGDAGQPGAAGCRCDDAIREAQLLDEGAHVAAAGGEALGSGVDDDAVELGPADRSAHGIRRLEQGDPHADLGELAGRDQPADPASDDDDVRGGGARRQFGLLFGHAIDLPRGG